MSEIAFETAAQAIRWALRTQPQQAGSTLASLMVRTSQGGMDALERAGQAAMILRRLQELPERVRAILYARHAPRTVPCDCGRACCSGDARNEVWRDAVVLVATYASDAIQTRGEGRHRLRLALVARYFGHADSITDIAERCGVSRRTATDENGLLVPWLRAAEQHAGQAAEALWP